MVMLGVTEAVSVSAGGMNVFVAEAAISVGNFVLIGAGVDIELQASETSISTISKINALLISEKMLLLE
jgi:hypothetical protein